MNTYFIAEKDYKLVEFTKEQKDIVKRVKEYSNRNCRNAIEKSFITKTLNNFDYGLAYFRTEILKANSLIKERPCAFACIKKQDNDTLILMLICAIQNTEKIGTKILNNVFDYAKNNKFIKILLECNEKNKSFYKKFDFKDEVLIDNDLFIMTKYI